MVELDRKLNLARSLFGSSPSQSTATVKGTVMADSSAGTVSVKIGEVEYDEDGNIVVPESDLIATIPIIGSAQTGDEVTVIVEDGSPTAIAAPGWGDEIAAGVEKTQYITYVQSGADAGLHIHEDASDYNTDGDLHLDSGGVEIRDSGTVLASFKTSGLEFLSSIYLKISSTILGVWAYLGKDNRDSNFCGLQIEDRGLITTRLVGDTVDFVALQNVTPPQGDISCGSNPLFMWYPIAQTTGSNSATIDLTYSSEVMVVADVLRNGAHHYFTCNIPVWDTAPYKTITSTAAEYKLGGYVGANASTSGGAWCSMSKTTFAGVAAWINNTSFISATTWTVYAR